MPDYSVILLAAGKMDFSINLLKKGFRKKIFMIFPGMSLRNTTVRCKY